MFGYPCFDVWYWLQSVALGLSSRYQYLRFGVRHWCCSLVFSLNILLRYRSFWMESFEFVSKQHSNPVKETCHLEFQHHFLLATKLTFSSTVPANLLENISIIFLLCIYLHIQGEFFSVGLHLHLIFLMTLCLLFVGKKKIDQHTDAWQWNYFHLPRIMLLHLHVRQDQDM